MSHRPPNILSNDENNFGLATDPLFGGWSCSVNAAIKRVNSRGFYNKYTPTSTFDASKIGNSLGCVVSTPGVITVTSPWVSVEANGFYMVSVFVSPSVDDAKFTLDFEVNTLADGTGQTYSVNSSLTPPLVVDIPAEFGTRLYRQFVTLSTTNYARMKVTIQSDSGGSFPANSAVWLYDPIICDNSFSSRGEFTATVYDDLPSFMRLDDENISTLAEGQPQLPLHRFVESLCSPLDEINTTVADFDYQRAVDGPVHLSTLTDPYTANADYLAWLAAVTGTKLFSFYTGYTPWGALESYDSADAGTVPGQWQDVESLVNWSEIQTLAPEFYDAVEGFRDQIATGVSGVNAGRTDVQTAFAKTLLDSGDQDLIVVSNGDKSDSFKVKLLVDPDSDPDLTGTFVSDAVGKGLSVGASVTKTNLVSESGSCLYDFTKLVYPATFSADEDAAGVVEYGQPSISDSGNFGRQLLLNDAGDVDRPELGGNVGGASFSTGQALLYGLSDDGVFTSATTESSILCDIGGSTTGFDMIVVLTDVTTPKADLNTVSSSTTPADWLFREKRLIACGTDSDTSNDNDWALYLVSGLTPNSEPSTRIMLVEGYNGRTGSFYAYSDPVDIAQYKKDVVIRVKRGPLTAGQGLVTFYAQESLYDDWETNVISSSTITPTTESAGVYAGIQLLGSLTGYEWASADALSCAVKQFMLFTTPLVFEGQSSSSTEAHAILDGSAVQSFSYFTYDPDVNINFLTATGPYVSSIVATTSPGVNLQTTINKGSSNISRILAMREGAESLWYFGSTVNTASADNVIKLTGLTASTSYDVKTRVLTPSTGVFTDHIRTFTTNGSGELTFSCGVAYNSGGTTYNNTSVSAITVYSTSNGSAGGTVLGTFTSSTFSNDSVTSGNWTLSRTFPVTNIEYAPAQKVDRAAFHMLEGTVSVAFPPRIEIYKPFSLFMKVRRFWEVGTHSIFRLVDDAELVGLELYYDDAEIKVDFTSSTTTSVAWTEATPDFGQWHSVLVVFDPLAAKLKLYVDDLADLTETALVTDNVLDEITQGFLGESGFNARVGVSDLLFFDRVLSDREIDLLFE